MVRQKPLEGLEEAKIIKFAYMICSFIYFKLLLLFQVGLRLPSLIKHAPIKGHFNLSTQLFCPRWRNHFQYVSLNSMINVSSICEVSSCNITSITSTLLVVQFILALNLQCNPLKIIQAPQQTRELYGRSLNGGTYTD